MNRTVIVGMYGLSARDARMVEIVLSRTPPGARFTFETADAGAFGRCEVALVDMQSPDGAQIFAQVRLRFPTVVPVCISDHGMMGESRFRIPRPSLLMLLHRTLEQVVVEELTGANKVQSLHRPGWIPVRAPTNKAIVDPSQALVSTPSHKTDAECVSEFMPLTALVVDDSLAVRRQLEAALERSGISGTGVENAEQAMQELSHRHFDLVFLDVVMPGIDGYELCRTIKKNTYTRRTPVLMLTSRSSPFDRARGALAGCDSYLVKPITWETFHAAIDKTLTHQFHNDRKLMAARGYQVALV